MRPLVGLLLLSTVGMGILVARTPASVAGSARLVWDPNPPEEDVVAYRVFFGPVSREDPDFSGYLGAVDVGDALGIDVDRLGCGRRDCYAAVTARNALGLESAYSEELSVNDADAPSSSGGSGGCFLNALQGRRPKLRRTSQAGVEWRLDPRAASRM